MATLMERLATPLREEAEAEMRTPTRRQLARHGKPDLLFIGAQLAAVADISSPSKNWWDFALYKTSVGAYLLSATFHVVEEGDRAMPTVLSFASPERLLEFFQHQAATLSDTAKRMLSQAADNDDALKDCMSCAAGEDESLRRRPIGPALRNAFGDPDYSRA